MLAGVLLLTHGMGAAQTWAMMGGGALVVGGLATLGLVLAGQLGALSEMPAAAAHLRVAVASLFALGVMGLLLIADAWFGFLPDHQGFAVAHAVIATYGFMGMLAMGFSFVLMPMFAVGTPPGGAADRLSAWLGGAALVCGFVGLSFDLRPLAYAAAGIGLAAAACHLRAMVRVMKTRLKTSLGGSFLLVRLGWAMLPASIVAGTLALAGVSAQSAPLFGFLLVFGWLLTFLLAVMQRILPFLASMHSIGPGRSVVPVSAITAAGPLRVHLVCHVLALILVAGGIAGDNVLAVRLGATAGVAGAAAYAVFGGLIWWRMAPRRRPGQRAEPTNEG
jgi:hypothetical protein